MEMIKKLDFPEILQHFNWMEFDDLWIFNDALCKLLPSLRCNYIVRLLGERIEAISRIIKQCELRAYDYALYGFLMANIIKLKAKATNDQYQLSEQSSV